MTKNFYFTIFTLVAMATLLIFVSCSKEKPKETVPAQITNEETAPEEILQDETAEEAVDNIALSSVIDSLIEEFPNIAERAEELIPTITRSSRLPRGIGKDDAWVYLYMASAYEEPSTVAAGLHAMSSSFTGRQNMMEKNQEIDARFVQTLMYHLHSDNGLILANAIEAAGVCLASDEAIPEVVKTMVYLANNHPDPAAKYEVLRKLHNSSTIRNDPEQMQAYVNALDSDESFVVSIALFHMGRIVRDVPDKDALKKRLIELIGHEDGGVRGRAAERLAGLVGNRGEDREEMGKLIMPLLEDSNHFARAKSFGALQELDYRPAIHHIIKLVEEDTKNTYFIEFTKLDGTSNRVHHDGSAWSVIADAALASLRAWSRNIGERFEYRISGKTREEDIAEAARSARQWYESVKDEIPQPKNK